MTVDAIDEFNPNTWLVDVIRMTEPVEMFDYDPGWVPAYEMLRDRLAKSLGNTPIEIEHVGSTSVPGTSAKPIIDIDVVVPSEDSVSHAIELLAMAGYRHKGDLGIRGREAFESPDGLPAHHLYLVVSGNREHVRHVVFRDYLRNHPDEARKYSDLKKSLAMKFKNDRDGYTEAKTEFIERILGLATK